MRASSEKFAARRKSSRHRGRRAYRDSASPRAGPHRNHADPQREWAEIRPERARRQHAKLVHPRFGIGAIAKFAAHPAEAAAHFQFRAPHRVQGRRIRAQRLDRTPLASHRRPAKRLTAGAGAISENATRDRRHGPPSGMRSRPGNTRPGHGGEAGGARGASNLTKQRAGQVARPLL